MQVEFRGGRGGASRDRRSLLRPLEASVVSFPGSASLLVPRGTRAGHAAHAPFSSGRPALSHLARPWALPGSGGVGGARAGLAATCRTRYGRQGVQQPHAEEGPLNRGQRRRCLLVASWELGVGRGVVRGRGKFCGLSVFGGGSSGGNHLVSNKIHRRHH